MQGDTSKALIIVSKAKGWDPTVIPARGDNKAESIANFDKAPKIYENQAGTGKLPQGVPGTFPDAEEPRYRENTTNDDGITWNYPKVSRETKNRRTNNASDR